MLQPAPDTPCYRHPRPIILLVINGGTKMSVSIEKGGILRPVKNERRRIIVAGGAGFVGGHLCHRLVRDGHEVICIDNFQTGRLCNIEHLQADDRFTCITYDIVRPLPDVGKVDEIYNLACAASPKKYQADPIHTFKTNVFGAINLLDLAVRDNATILQSSTSEVYGDPEVTPQPETYRGNVNTMGPRSCYDEGKRAVETLFHDYHNARGARARVARIFNTYGPGMCPSDGRVISNFVVQALSGEAVTVYGDGQQTRSFCFISDLVDGLLALMAAPDGPVEPVNLGNPGEFTIDELAHSIIATLKSDSVVQYLDLPVDDPKRRRPDISKAAAYLNWSPKVSLADGLRVTIPYFAAEIGKANGKLLVAE